MNNRGQSNNECVKLSPFSRSVVAEASWLLSELYPADPDVAFGLCDLGVGFPELGDVRLSELTALRGPFGLPVERDRHFRATKTLTQYANDARAAQRITA